MNLPYDTLQDLAKELKLRHFPGICSLPYNRFDCDKSQYGWLSPTITRALRRPQLSSRHSRQ